MDIQLPGQPVSEKEFAELPEPQQRAILLAAIEGTLDQMEVAECEPDAWQGYWLRMAIAALVLRLHREAFRFLETARWPVRRQGAWRVPETPKRTVAALRLALGAVDRPG